MSDSSWVRLFAGQRSRTPTRSASPALPSPTALVLENSYFGREKPCDEKPGMVRSLAPSLTSAAGQDSSVTGQILLVNNDDQVQQNPKVDEMAEALRVAIMTRPAIATLGPEFTSYVLHLVEGYADVKKKLREMEELFDEAITLRKQESEAFTKLAERWDEEEMQYRAEIKRLELFIHDTSDKGVAAVLLARAGSQLRKKQQRRRFEAATRDRDDGDHTAPDGSLDKDADEMLVTHQSEDKYSILTRRRNLDPRLDFEISERIRRLCTASPADEGQHEAPRMQNQPTQTSAAPRPRDRSPAPSLGPSVISSSSSSSGSETGDDAGYASRYVTPDSPEADEELPDPPRDAPHDPINMDGSPDLEGEADCTTYGRALLPPPANGSSSIPARRGRHRREFSFAPGDDVLGIVQLRSPTASAFNNPAEEKLDPTVVPSVERKPGDSNSV